MRRKLTQLAERENPLKKKSLAYARIALRAVIFARLNEQGYPMSFEGSLDCPAFSNVRLRDE